MKAMVYHRYGGPEVVGLAEVPTPIAKDNEVLIRKERYRTAVELDSTSARWKRRALSFPPGGPAN